MKTPVVQLLICHCHLQTAVVEIDKVCVFEDTSSSVTCIIDLPLTLTDYNGRGKQSVSVKSRERMKTPVVQ